jgi:hypothetical protein
MARVVILATGAQWIPKLTPELKAERDTEYHIGLSKLFSWNLPVYGILSECDPDGVKQTPFGAYPFQQVLAIPSTHSLGGITKSQKEFLSIQQWVCESKLQDPNTWILKMSARYIPLNDQLLQSLSSLPNECEFLGKHQLPCPTAPYPQVITFCFAMRWSAFQEFYLQDVRELGTQNVEKFLADFLLRTGRSKKAFWATKLGILVNINNNHTYEIH